MAAKVEGADVQPELDARPVPPVVAEHAGDATVVAYSVVHARDGGPEWGLLVTDTGGARAYARVDDAGAAGADHQAFRSAGGDGLGLAAYRTATEPSIADRRLTPRQRRGGTRAS